MPNQKPDSRIQLLLQMVDQAFHQHSWHGTTLRGSLRGLSIEQALWRPGSERHNIWELILHTAYWKYIVRRRSPQTLQLAICAEGSHGCTAQGRCDSAPQ
jgi:hypothetical protein